MYRFHIEDPIRFRESIRVTIEHGHANDALERLLQHGVLVPDEPHAPPPALPPVAERLPR